MLSHVPLDLESQQIIRTQAGELAKWPNYILGMLSMFSSSVEAERLFREAGRQLDGRESLAGGMLEAEVWLCARARWGAGTFTSLTLSAQAILIDHLKSNAKSEDEYKTLVEKLAKGIIEHRERAKEERKRQRAREAEAMERAAKAAAERAAAARRHVDDDDDPDDKVVDDID